MGLAASCPSRRMSAAPCTRGDGPVWEQAKGLADNCSPQARGWSLPQEGPRCGTCLLPARGDGPATGSFATPIWPCSPHPQGWSRNADRLLPEGRLLPAHAGMFPSGLQRGCGGGAAPRARGDVPVSTAVGWTIPYCSPHPRGCSRHDLPGHSGRRLLPAPAGMFPTSASSPPCQRPAPRTRGDVPWATPFGVNWAACSPHPRGCSRDVLEPGEGLGLLPRTRGDVPDCPAIEPGSSSCSLHPQGCSPLMHEFVEDVVLLPPAGMFPGSRSDTTLRGDVPGTTWYYYRPPPAPRTRGDVPGAL